MKNNTSIKVFLFEKPQLKECPFCGGKADIDIDVKQEEYDLAGTNWLDIHIGCKACNIKMHARKALAPNVASGAVANEIEAIVAAWNHRAVPVIAEPAKAVSVENEVKIEKPVARKKKVVTGKAVKKVKAKDSTKKTEPKAPVPLKRVKRGKDTINYCVTLPREVRDHAREQGVTVSRYLSNLLEATETI